MDEATKTRFWTNVRKGPGCWEWIGERKDEDGYGRFVINGRRVGAHRAAWLLTFGPIPDGLRVCHHCDNPPCCRIDHLFLSTQAGNLHDMTNKGRRADVRCRGERNGIAKLTETDVLDIRTRLAAGEAVKALARAYGVDPANVRSIGKRKTWAHVA